MYPLKSVVRQLWRLDQGGGVALSKCPGSVGSAQSGIFLLMDADANRSLIIAALAQISSGDRAALQTVYRLTSAKLFGVVMRILGERSDAEDVLQEVYLTVWQKASAFDASQASPMSWLIAIARNRAIDRLRSTGRKRHMASIEAAADIVDPAPGADRALEKSEANARLQVCLDTLAERESAALRAAFFDGNTYEELATRMGVPLGTIKSTIRRAMIKLKACLEQ
jgi:RNA polymerase sigma factor (sigma-70 family)